MARIPRCCLPILALGLTLLPTLLIAGEEGGGEGGGGSQSYLALIIESGPVQWVLILLSIIGTAIAIQRIITLKKETLVPDGLADDMIDVLRPEEEEGVPPGEVTDEQWEEALGIAQSDDSMLGEILAAALDKRDFGYDAMKAAAETVGASEQNKYVTQISWLSLIAAVGPMLGLLGTVWGMIKAFFTMAAVGGTPDPSALSGSIGGAMITTATGLIVAIPMMVLFFFLRARVNASVLEAGILTDEVLDCFRPQQQ